MKSYQILPNVVGRWRSRGWRGTNIRLGGAAENRFGSLAEHSDSDRNSNGNGDGEAWGAVIDSVRLEMDEFLGNGNVWD